MAGFGDAIPLNKTELCPTAEGLIGDPQRPAGFAARHVGHDTDIQHTTINFDYALVRFSFQVTNYC
jgi:hypothetical protein